MTIDTTKRIPLCQSCKGWMIFSFALRGCEYVCPKCGTGEEMFNGCEKVEISAEAYREFSDKNYDRITEIGKNSGEYQ